MLQWSLFKFAVGIPFLASLLVGQIHIILNHLIDLNAQLLVDLFPYDSSVNKESQQEAKDHYC